MTSLSQAALPLPKQRTDVRRVAYKALWRILGPFLPFYLRRRARRGKEDVDRLGERFGRSALARPDGPLLWIHGASVGESLSILPLLERLLLGRPDLGVLFTTGTVTSAEILAGRLPDRAFHQFIPLDHPDAVKRFLDHWRPDAAFWLESEFWPNLLGEIAVTGMPAALINARMSDQSYSRWKRRPAFIGEILRCFTSCLAQDEPTAEKLRDLGAVNVTAPGNLKFAALPLPDIEDERRDLESRIGSRLTIVAAQTVEGEERTLASILLDLKTRYRDPLLIIVPKHVGRGPEIKAAVYELGLTSALRSSRDLLSDDIDIYIADTMGELGLFYRLTAPVFLGRSLVPGFGGSNLLEPARFGRYIIQGPYTDNFKEANALFASAGASHIARDQNDLRELIVRALETPELTSEIGAKAQDVASSASSVLDRISELVTPLLPEREEPRASS